jgi:SAM-dependent methyltransferase
MSLEQIRTYWDADAASYDDVTNHAPTSAGEVAAWSTVLARLLPPSPARILDCGAGTGFLSLTAARLGHKVTAVDVSGAMLDHLRRKADAEGLVVDVVEGPAEEPPAGPFDAVVERHVLWTLGDPVGALRAWRAAAPEGRLLCIEGVWGDVDRVEALRAIGRRALRRLRGQADDHHAGYDPAVLATLPLGSGTPPSKVVEAVVASGWPDPWLERLHDVEWAATVDLPMPERLLGVPARFVVTAG